jgi:hypothetical protein
LLTGTSAFFYYIYLEHLMPNPFGLGKGRELCRSFAVLRLARGSLGSIQVLETCGSLSEGFHDHDRCILPYRF